MIEFRMTIGISSLDSDRPSWQTRYISSRKRGQIRFVRFMWLYCSLNIKTAIHPLPIYAHIFQATWDISTFTSPSSIFKTIIVLFAKRYSKPWKGVYSSESSSWHAWNWTNWALLTDVWISMLVNKENWINFRSFANWSGLAVSCEHILVNLACEQALKVNWEPASMTNEFEYLRLKSWREILIGQML